MNPSTKHQARSGTLPRIFFQIIKTLLIISFLGQHTCELSQKRHPVGVYKINVNEATLKDGRKSSVGVIIRDFKGEVATGLCKSLPRNYMVLEIKVMVGETRILLAQEMELQQVIIESSSLSVVQNLLSKEVKGEIGHLVQGNLILDFFNSWKIKHLKRDYNKVAHELVHFGRCNETCQVWKGVSPPMVRHLIHLDCL